MTQIEGVEVGSVAEHLKLAMEIAREAGAILRERVNTKREIDYKGLVNLVTDADRASEALIASRLHAAYPDHRLIGEEGARNEAAGDSPYVWIFDPLDGTTNYAHAYPHFAVSIALRWNDTTLLGVIYDPMRDEMFSAERGKGAYLNGEPFQVSTVDELVHSLLATGFAYAHGEREQNLGLFTEFLMKTQGPRRDGAAALNLAWTAAGRLDGFWERHIEAWDVAAGTLIVEEAGGRVTNYANGPFDPFARECLATNGTALHDAMVEILVRHTS
ncbi:inositol monophosphatase family protein [soil metagenome]